VDARVGAEQQTEQLAGARLWQSIEAGLAVVGLAAPAVVILRTVVHQKQEASGGQTLDQAIEHGLGLAVDPVKILDDKTEGPALALSEQ
jgi:hypothetical protein